MIDGARLQAWLDERGIGTGPLETAFISGGTQNEIYELRREGLHGALRMPPAAAPAARDDGILREWRIIEALDGTDVPHTAAIASCPAGDVLGRPFYVMGFVDGWSPMNTDGWPAPFDADLRPVRPRAQVRSALKLVHDGGSLGDAVHRCTGVGKCVAPATNGVMWQSRPTHRSKQQK